MRQGKLLLSGCVALWVSVAVMGVAAGVAASSTWRFASRAIEVAGTLEIKQNTLPQVLCNVTLGAEAPSEGFPNRGSTALKISRVTLGSCFGGSLRFLLEAARPWAIRYGGIIGGALPDRVSNLGFEGEEALILVETSSSACLYRFTMEGFTGLTFIEGSQWEYSTGTFNLFGRVPFEGAISLGRGSCSLNELSFSSSRRLPTVSLNGVIVSPLPLEFGRVEGGTIGTRTVTLTGSRSGTTISGIRMRTGRYFSITDPNGCRGRTLRAGATCSISAAFFPPTEPHIFFEDVLLIETTEAVLEDIVRGNNTIIR
ncbi:MAG: hypothetical protein JSS99_11115 [Actinobacteria bacterium]|nr:hypothetical protein [Actinomycetota bacterium]